MKIIFNIIRTLLLFTIISSCSSDDDKSEGNDSGRKVTISINNLVVRGAYLLGDPRNPGLVDSWGKTGSSFYIFVEQDGIIHGINGLQHTKETSLDDEARKSTVHVEFDLPKNINQSKKYKVLALLNDDGGIISNGEIDCNTDLKRGLKQIHSWYYTECSNGYMPVANGNYLTASEVLYINNSTNKTIKVKHKGYDVAEKWYYTSSHVSLVNGNGGFIMLPSGSIGTTDIVSEAIEVEAGENGYIMSAFVPNGKKMQNARLILEIDGKEIKSETVSSNVVMENGKPYFITAIWDGNSLSWLNQSE